jgi:Lipopolysaccharide-assembly
MKCGPGIFPWPFPAVFPPLVLLFTGCAGYQLGPTNARTAGAQSIQVNSFANKTPEPRLGEAITFSLRKRLQQDGTYRLNTSDAGDIIVNGTIIDYDRSHVSLQPQDVLTPQDYRVTIRAHITARERVTGKIVLNRNVAGHSTLRVGSDLTSSERQAIPLVAEDLARKATSLLVDGSW